VADGDDFDVASLSDEHAHRPDPIDWTAFLSEHPELEAERWAMIIQMMGLGPVGYFARQED
jgi:hypothetical protein